MFPLSSADGVHRQSDTLDTQARYSFCVRQAVVHIGTPKTATTALQRFLQTNSNALKEAGWFTPGTWANNHSELSVLAYPEDRWDEAHAFQARRRGYGELRLSKHQQDRLRGQIIGELHGLVGQSHGSTLLFSSEGLYSRLSSPEIRRLRETLIDVGVDAEILVYVRDPLSARLSQVGQFVKEGWHLNLQEALLPWNMPQRLPRREWVGAPQDQETPYELYSRRIGVWEEYFPGRVHVRLFDPIHLAGGGIAQDFCHSVGISWESRFTKSSRVNPGLPWTVIKILNEVNRRVNRRALMADGSFNASRWLRPRELSRFSLPTRKVRPSKELVESFQSYFSTSNEAIRRSYFPDREFLWDPVRQACESETHLSVDLTSDEWIMVELFVQIAESQLSNHGGADRTSRLQLHPSVHKRALGWAARGIKRLGHGRG